MGGSYIRGSLSVKKQLSQFFWKHAISILELLVTLSIFLEI